MRHFREHLAQRDALCLINANTLDGQHRQTDVAEQAEDGENSRSHKESMRVDLMRVAAVHNERHDIANDGGA